jgi:hypothetical protein
LSGKRVITSPCQQRPSRDATTIEKRHFKKAILAANFVVALALVPTGKKTFP